MGGLAPVSSPTAIQVWRRLAHCPRLTVRPGSFPTRLADDSCQRTPAASASSATCVAGRRCESRCQVSTISRASFRARTSGFRHSWRNVPLQFRSRFPESMKNSHTPRLYAHWSTRGSSAPARCPSRSPPRSAITRSSTRATRTAEIDGRRRSPAPHPCRGPPPSACVVSPGRRPFVAAAAASWPHLSAPSAGAACFGRAGEIGHARQPTTLRPRGRRAH